MNPLLFTDPSFLFFFAPIVLTGYWLAPARWRNGFLLLASLLLYGWGEGRYAGVLLASIAINWTAGVAISRATNPRPRKTALIIGVASNLLLLATFKYLTFFIWNLNLLLHSAEIQAPDWHLPVGLSFYTFMGISYLVDLYRRDLDAPASPPRMALFLSMFPHLIAGPIVRMTEIGPQFGIRLAKAEPLAAGIRRFVIGFGKKMLLANTLSTASDAIFALPSHQLPTSLAWFGLLCYTLQIYYDFSGYTDMAIGLARILGFEFPENFNYPYISQSIGEFWRRWHITLSHWLRDYLFFPLGVRGGRLKMVRNQLIVFFLCGLWHGASYNFILWGMWHGTLLGIEQLGLQDKLKRLPSPLRIAYTLIAVSLGWVLFRSATLPAAMDFYAALAGFGSSAPPDSWIAVKYIGPATYVALAAAIAGATPLKSIFKNLEARFPAFTGPAEFTALSAVFLAALASTASDTFHPFIYFRF
ncbi:MAG TPA: MBOAT family O-acyltransferase [Bryobacteraceae bacterium]|jgi:alginate O-acetyltransferase complex protein AlgI